jgi:hypothetical protein
MSSFVALLILAYLVRLPLQLIPRRKGEGEAQPYTLDDD